MTPRYLDLVQGTGGWLAWRLAGVGGSDVASVLGISPYDDATRADCLREKVTGGGKDLSFAMRRGQLLEPAARALYQDRRRPGHVKVCCVEHGLYPWARASLDGLCYPLGLPDGTPWVLEIKAPKWQVHDDALAGNVPEFNLVQCQWQLFCTGLKRLDYASYNPSKRYAEKDWLAVVPVARDEALIGTLANAAAEFWMEVLEAREAATVAEVSS